MEVAVKVVIMEGGEMAVETESHQKSGILVWQVPRGPVEYDPCWVKLKVKPITLEIELASLENIAVTEAH